MAPMAALPHMAVVRLRTQDHAHANARDGKDIKQADAEVEESVCKLEGDFLRSAFARITSRLFARAILIIAEKQAKSDRKFAFG